jgi:hypothetical protein
LPQGLALLYKFFLPGEQNYSNKMRSSAAYLILALGVLLSYDSLAQETPAPSLSPAVISQGEDEAVEIGNTTEQEDKEAKDIIKIPPLPSIVGTPYPAPSQKEEEVVSALNQVLEPLKAGQPLKSEKVQKQQPSYNNVASPPSSKRIENVVDFTKRIYSSLGTKSIADLAVDFKGDFEALNYDNKLSEELKSLYEMRLDDLQRSVSHAKKMRDLLEILNA